MVFARRRDHQRPGGRGQFRRPPRGLCARHRQCALAHLADRATRRTVVGLVFARRRDHRRRLRRVNSDGRLEVFVRGTDDALWHIWQTVPHGGPWSAWASLGGNITSDPVGSTTVTDGWRCSRAEPKRALAHLADRGAFRAVVELVVAWRYPQGSADGRLHKEQAAGVKAARHRSERRRNPDRSRTFDRDDDTTAMRDRSRHRRAASERARPGHCLTREASVAYEECRPMCRCGILHLAANRRLHGVRSITLGAHRWCCAVHSYGAFRSGTGRAWRRSTGAAADAASTDVSWRNVGPHSSGRMVAVAGSAARPNEYYFGTTGGGVWKTHRRRRDDACR